VPGVAAASMEPVRTAGKDGSVAGPDAVSDARRPVVGPGWAAVGLIVSLVSFRWQPS
jgi:hypothetical protein